MDRLVAVLLLVLVLAVTGLGLVVWQADDHARDDARTAHRDALEQACLLRVQATATVALMVPGQRVDLDGRLAAVEALGAQIEGC